MAGRGLPCPLRLFFHLLLLSITAPSLILLHSSHGHIVAADAATSEADALLEFKSSLASNGGDEALRNWAVGSNPCNGNISNWNGVLCFNGNVWGLQLENMSLSGSLRVQALETLSGLRTLSFMNNNFVGPMPDVGKLAALKSLFLSNNQFSGEIPDGLFAGMRWLKKVYLSNNEFSGRIPSSIKVLTKLLELRLDANEFKGQIPDFRQPGLKLLNVSYNKLEGKIPDRFQNTNPEFFAGNENLCGAPLDVSCPSSRKFPLVIVLIVISIIVLLAIFGIIFVRRNRQNNNVQLGHPSSIKSKNVDTVDVDKLEQGSASHNGNSGSGGGKKAAKETDHGKLVFVKEDRERFELQDLLRASAEVLGSGNFGSSYKAVLLSGPSVVVKRFKEMNGVGREDFNEHMRRLGRLSHTNLLPLVSYYYRKEEKLLVTDYIPNGSLAHMLHGNRGSNLPPLEWPTRLKIIKGVARGLAYLYEELPVLTLPHGHLKSSNVLVDDNYEPLLTDYALVPVMNQSHASQVMVAYKSPEVTEHGRPSKKSDVWSLGILILEILTGKFPATYLQKGKGGTDLAGWVNSLVKDEGTGEVFDNEMRGTDKSEGEMLKSLHIGLRCCEENIDKRWEMKEVLEKIEELKEIGSDEDNSSYGKKEGEVLP